MSIEIEDDAPVPPRSDLYAAVVWMVFGAAVAVGAWRMDRLEKLHINPYEIPGLVPFVLGVTILLLGCVLALRSLRQGALTAVSAGEAVVPAAELAAARAEIAKLQRVLGKKTLENEILKEAVEYAAERKWIARSPLLPGEDQ